MNALLIIDEIMIQACRDPEKLAHQEDGFCSSYDAEDFIFRITNCQDELLWKYCYKNKTDSELCNAVAEYFGYKERKVPHSLSKNIYKVTKLCNDLGLWMWTSFDRIKSGEFITYDPFINKNVTSISLKSCPLEATILHLEKKSQEEEFDTKIYNMIYKLSKNWDYFVTHDKKLYLLLKEKYDRRTSTTP